MADDKKPFNINWPKGATLTMDDKSLQEMRYGLEVQFKHIIYSQPGFEFFKSIGNKNFFQRFKTNDGLDFGTLHVYWDKDAENNIVTCNPETGERTNSAKGDWRHRWFKPDEKPTPFENSIISEEGMQKIYRIHAKKLVDAAQNENKRMMEKRQQRQKFEQEEDNEEEDEKILLN